MDNNLELISSIKVESDFEELVRRFVQELFGTNAFLVGGPWDGGRDLVWLVDGKESREAAQISTQEKNLESKLDEDLTKVVRLVEDHSYPPVLTFFWSHSLSASKQDDLKTNAKRKYRINLEIYDAKKLPKKSQTITLSCSDSFLRKFIRTKLSRLQRSMLGKEHSTNILH